MYRNAIEAVLAQAGRSDIDPRHVEAWMRLESGTLDHLSLEAFQRAVREALACIEASTPDENEELAQSYGL